MWTRLRPSSIFHRHCRPFHLEHCPSTQPHTPILSVFTTRASNRYYYCAGQATIAMTSATAFRLEPSLFNANLYANINTFWFADLPADATAPTQGLISRWYGMGSKDEKDAFDESCGLVIPLVNALYLTHSCFLNPSFLYTSNRLCQKRSHSEIQAAFQNHARLYWT